jgi:hypothetical protein
MTLTLVLSASCIWFYPLTHAYLEGVRRQIDERGSR